MEQKLIDRMCARTNIGQRRAIARIQRHGVLRVIDRHIERIAAHQTFSDVRVCGRQQHHVRQRWPATLPTERACTPLERGRFDR
jgi:hypothetical protein